MTKPPYRHEPLNLEKTQIRLLRLTASETNTLLTGTIATFDLEQCPEYKAVSYTWGPPDPTFEITLDWRSFQIRENLWHFLNAAKSQEGETWLWIDQICIDQFTVDERNHQVGLMASIYAQATEVLIWLGTEADGSDVAMAAINAGSEGVERRSVQVQALFQRPYWRRLWILQEVLMSKSASVLCGNKRCGWSSLGELFIAPRSATWVWEPPIQIDPIALAVIEEKNLTSYAEQRLSYILEVFSGLECEDVRDKIYGLLSLVRKSSAITVDYSKSAADVFFDTVQGIVAEDIGMDFESHLDACRKLRDRMNLTSIVDSTISSWIHEFTRIAMNLTPLSWAARSGHCTEVRQLLESGADPNCSKDSRAPLLQATTKSRHAVVAELLKNGAHTDCKDEDMQTPLLFAAKTGHAGILQLLLTHSADVNCRDKSDDTPLLAAVRGKHHTIAEQLLKAGADPNLKNRAGWTPLLWASTIGSLGTVAELLKMGADLNASNQYGNTPYSLAISRGHQQVVDLLLSKEADQVGQAKAGPKSQAQRLLETIKEKNQGDQAQSGKKSYAQRLLETIKIG
ncbi:hypothetical protein ACN47E_004046 [Coniothyrium glycines]